MNVKKVSAYETNFIDSPIRLRSRNVPRPLAKKSKEIIINEPIQESESIDDSNISENLANNFSKLIVDYSSSDSDVDDIDANSEKEEIYDVNDLNNSRESDVDELDDNSPQELSNHKVILTKTTKDRPLLIYEDYEYILEKKHK